MPPAAKKALLEQFGSFFARGKPKGIRSYLEFAEQEMRIVEGPFKNRKFKTYRQPFSRCVLEAYDDPRWERFILFGCVQSGKTLLGSVFPAAYHLFEVQENFGVGVPIADMASEKYRFEYEPTFRSSFPDLMPTKGAASRDGKKVEIVEFENKAALVFMSSKGGPAKRSGKTLRVLGVTEADKTDVPQAKSVNPNPIGEMEGRLAAAGENSRFWAECTVTTKAGFVYREWKAGSEGQMFKPCPHCHEWVVPGRKHLVGWQEAKSEEEAAELAEWICPHCAVIITDQERKEMCRQTQLVHKGQTVRTGDDGTALIEGDFPPTKTCGIRWNAFDNIALWSKEWIARKMWKALNPSTEEEDDESTEKWVSQYMWAEPWQPDVWTDVPLRTQDVRMRMTEYPQRQVPPDTLFLAGGVDLGKWYGHYVLPAFRTVPVESDEGECALRKLINVIDYNTFDVPSNSMPIDEAIYRALCELRDSIIEPGFADIEGQIHVPGYVFIDTRYRQDAVFRFIRDSNRMGLRRYLPSQGLGVSIMNERRVYKHPEKEDDEVKLGHRFFIKPVPAESVFRVTIDADEYKGLVRAANAIGVGEPGSMAFFSGGPTAHNTIARHIASEFEEWEIKPDKGPVKRYVNKSKRQNHFLDALYNSFGAGNLCGFRFDDAIEFIAQQNKDAGYQPVAITNPDGSPYLPIPQGASDDA